MTTQPTPIVTLESLCTESTPTFIANEQSIKFGLTDFAGKEFENKYTRKSGFYVQQEQTINTIALQDLPIYHELHLKQESAQYIQCMQIHQNPNKATEFNLLIGAKSGCCDGAVLGGLYSIEDNSFDIKFAKRVPFNTYGIIGYLPYPAQPDENNNNNNGYGNILSAGSGCDGAGIQHFTYNHRNTEQEFIFNVQKFKDENIDPRIAKYTPSYESFQYNGTLCVKDNSLTVAGLNLEEAFKISQQYYKHKELLEIETDEDKKKSRQYTIDAIEEMVAKIRLTASQSKFMERNTHEVYP